MLKQDGLWHGLLQGRKCFLLDLDGTLIDSSECHERAYKAALQAQRPDLVPGFLYEQYKGWSTKDTFIALGIENESAVTRLTESKQELYRAMIDNGEVMPIPFARELLELLKQLQFRLFIVTGASRRPATAALEKLNFIDFFEAMITGDEVERSKPAPDCYLRCMELCGVANEHAIAVEDGLSGVESAKAAGLDCLAVNNPSLTDMPEYAGSLLDIHHALLA